MLGSVMAFLKRGDKRGGDTSVRLGYKMKLVTEILTDAPVLDGYISAEMQWGLDNEDLARAAY